MLTDNLIGDSLRLIRFSGMLMSQAPVLPATKCTPRHAAAGRHRLALAIVVTCQLMLVLDATVMNVALPHIKTDLHFSATGLTWVMTSYTLSFGGLLLLGGRAGDVFGRRRMFLAGAGLFTLASLVGGLAPTATWLIVARVAQGMGAAAAGPSTVALITTTFTEARERIRALALLSAAAGAGFAIGLMVGGVLTDIASWRWVLFINVPFGIAVVTLAPRFVAEPPRHPARLDLAGAVAATLGMTSLVYGLLRAPTSGWSNPETVLGIALGAALITTFVLIEAWTKAPLLPLRLFGERNRAAGYINFLLGAAAMMSTFFFLTQYLQEARRFSPVLTGLAFMPLAVAMFTMTRVVPRLLPRFGPRPLNLIGTAVMAGGLLWLAQIDASTRYFPGVFGPLLVMGLGASFAFVSLPPVIFASVPPQDAGAAGGALQTMQQLGATLGLSALVTVAASASNTMVGGMSIAFTISAGITATAFLVATTFRKADAVSLAR
jgi:EmrB/QacA subfamily drug resistance transporter